MFYFRFSASRSNPWLIVIFLWKLVRLTESCIFLYRAAGIMIPPRCQISSALRALLFSIDRRGLCFCPLAHCLQPRLCEMTRHVAWPHPGQHLWVFWARCAWWMSLRWRAADGVASKGHDAEGSAILLSHFHFGPTPPFSNTCRPFPKGQPAGTKLILWFTLFYQTVQMQLVGWSNTGIKRKASNLVHSVCQIGLHPACT